MRLLPILISHDSLPRCLSITESSTSDRDVIQAIIKPSCACICSIQGANLFTGRILGRMADERKCRGFHRGDDVNRVKS